MRRNTRPTTWLFSTQPITLLRLSMDTEHKIAVFRHLIGEPDVTFAQCQLVHIRLVQHSAVHGHMAVLVHGDHVTRLADHTLEQELVLPIKAAQVAGFYKLMREWTNIPP